MYKLTPKLAEYLLTHSKDPQIPGIKDGEDKPFQPKNLHSIGVIDPQSTIGTNFDYTLHHEYTIGDSKNPTYIPDVKGCWLYKRDELKVPKEKVTIKRSKVDPYTTDLKEELDITDCCIDFPSSVEQLTAQTISSLEKLIEKEPGIKDCLEENEIAHRPWFSHRQ